MHELQGVAYGLLLGYGDGIVDHAVLGTLYAAHVRSLLGDGHILVNHAYASFTSERYGQRSLGDRIHGGRHDGYVQLDISRKVCLGRDCPRQHF